MKYFPAERQFHEEYSYDDTVDDLDDDASEEGRVQRDSLSLTEEESAGDDRPNWLRSLNWSSLADEKSSAPNFHSLKRPHTTRAKKSTQGKVVLYNPDTLKSIYSTSTHGKGTKQPRRRKFSDASWTTNDSSSPTCAASPYANTFRGVNAPDLKLAPGMLNSFTLGAETKNPHHSAPSLMISTSSTASTSSDTSLYGRHVVVTKSPAISPMSSKRTPASRMHEPSLLHDAFNAPIILRKKGKKKKQHRNIF
jgi:hypothetical protein